MRSTVKQAKASHLRMRRLERVIGRFVGDPDGPSLIAVGSIHGNETSGRIALERVAEFLRTSNVRINGRIYLFTGNVRASEESVRFIDADLNRRWTREHILTNTPPRTPSYIISEDREQHELLRLFHDVLGSAADEVYALDLHSTSATGLPFATVGDTMRNRRFVMQMPVNIVLGIEEQLEGTMLEFLNNEGAVTLGFEAGQHDAASSVGNHEALVLVALVHSGIIQKEDLARYDEYMERLARATQQPRIIEVRHREAITTSDDFKMEPGFRNFDPVTKGQKLATNRNGDITSPESGMIMMPLYQKQGEDGFFIVREVAPIWLHVSAALRAVDLGRFLRFLPGVRRHPKRPEQLRVDTRIARFFPLQVFHLLGFRRLRWMDNFLIVSRRRFDTQSPFQKWRV
jgi:succinylglutamate desuccinylase